MIFHAIVLKNYFPQKNKVTLLHEQLGKIDIFIQEKDAAARLCNGSLIYCVVEKKGSRISLDFIDPYFIPSQYDVQDLYFLHEVLKICLQFMPERVGMHDVFDLLVEMYENFNLLLPCHKKIYQLKLFLYLGIFPENKKLYHLVMQQMNTHDHSVDQFLQEGLRYCWNSDINYS